MRILRNILTEYIDAELPSTEDVARMLTMKSYEVEAIGDYRGEDFMEVDVLPNRASDSLSQIGVAREVAYAYRFKHTVAHDEPVLEEVHPEKITIEIENETARRFVAVSLSGLVDGVTPDWLKLRLEALGERSINPIVDVTNYVMLLTGQPLHAYDTDKIAELSGGELTLGSRMSKAGEKLITLEGEEHELTGAELIIASGETPLGLAGLKGGKESRVTENTSRIILEAASFNPVLIRKSSQKVKLKTNASKRFENGVPEELCALGINEALRILREIYPDMRVEALKDYYPQKNETTSVHVKYNHAPRLLGVDIPKETQVAILEMIGCDVESEGAHMKVKAPWYRPDLISEVDFVEEIGRLYGLDNIPATPLSPTKGGVAGETVLAEALRDALTGAGYSEVLTRAFRPSGEIAVANPLDKRQPYLRNNLRLAVEDTLERASHNAELLEIEIGKVFEMGTVFTQDGERLSLGIGALRTKNSRAAFNFDTETEALSSMLSKTLGVDVSGFVREKGTSKDSLYVEFDLTALEDALGGKLSWRYEEPVFNVFREFSQFPYVLRDIAIWTTPATAPEDIESVISHTASDLLQTITLFDRFEKDFDGEKRVSYAFKLVFQSFEKTLSDEEVNSEMGLISSALSSLPGSEVR